MTPEMQKQLIETLLNNLKLGVMERIKYLPAHWTGFEIRQWIADLYLENFVIDMKPLVKRAYRNDKRLNPNL